jgi:hypothetical protein
MATNSRGSATASTMVVAIALTRHVYLPLIMR